MNINIIESNEPLLGIAIATFNRKNILKECLEAINKSSHQNIFICVVDDGSSDGTDDMLQLNFPSVKVIRGDGNLWWAEATNRAIKKCLEAECEYVVLLNDDCMLMENTLAKFIERSKEYPSSVIAPMVMNIENPDQVWWAGSSWGPLSYFPCIWLIRQKFSHGTAIDRLPKDPFETSEFTGRGVFIPKDIFKKVGLIDADVFPQYGSDNDFSLRITSSDNKAIVDPKNRVLLYVEEAGQNQTGNIISLPIRFFKLLFFRKNGEAAIFWWKLLKRHTPWYAFLPSYFFIILLIFLRVFKILPLINKILGRVK